VASKCIYTLARLRSQSASLSSPDHSLPVYLHPRSIMVSMCITKLACLRSPNSLDYGPQVHMIMASKCISTCLITISVCISKFTRSRPLRVSPNTLDYSLQVHLQSCSITSSESISEFTRSSFSGSPQIGLKHCQQPVQIYRVLMGSYIDA
jgi:hypothetical protein